MTRTGRRLLWFLPPLVVIGAFLATLPWLKEEHRALIKFTAPATVLFVIVWSIAVERRVGRTLDEVQQASQRFAMRYGTTAGTLAFALLLMVAPFNDFATAFVIEYGNPGPGQVVDRSVVVFAMMLGFVGVIMLQMIGWIVMGALWWQARR